MANLLQQTRFTAPEFCKAPTESLGGKVQGAAALSQIFSEQVSIAFP